MPGIVYRERLNVGYIYNSESVRLPGRLLGVFHLVFFFFWINFVYDSIRRRDLVNVIRREFECQCQF